MFCWSKKCKYQIVCTQPVSGILFIKYMHAQYRRMAWENLNSKTNNSFLCRSHVSLIKKKESPCSTWAGLNPLLKAFGAPHSVLIITLWYGWYQKSYPNSTGSRSHVFFITKLVPSSNIKPPNKIQKHLVK